MPGIIENRSTYGELVKGVSAKFGEVFNQSMESYSLAINDAVAVLGNKLTKLFKEKTSDKSKERTVTKSGVGYLQATEEGVAFNQDSRQAGYTTEWQFKKFTNGVTVTLEAMEDRDYESALDEFSDLTISAQETFDKHAFQMFNYGFTAQASSPNTYSKYGDGQPMFSTVHTRADGGTAQSNASATGLVFSEPNLEVARLALQGQLDDRGKPMRVGTGKLILLIPTDLEKQAVIFTKGEKRSGTANNDINIYDGLMTVISSQYLRTAFGGSATQWMVIDPRVAKIMHWVRKGVTPSRYIDNRTKDTTFDLYARWTDGWADWRGMWGSTGDGASYAL